MSGSKRLVMPVGTVCRCRATDGMCHGWEGNTVLRISWAPPTNTDIRCTFDFAPTPEGTDG